MTSGIYILRWKDDSVYIGQSVNIASRLASHKSKMRRYEHSNPEVQAAYNTMGDPQYITQAVVPEYLLNAAEIYYIKKFSQVTTVLNRTKGGGSRGGGSNDAFYSPLGETKYSEPRLRPGSRITWADKYLFRWWTFFIITWVLLGIFK